MALIKPAFLSPGELKLEAPGMEPIIIRQQEGSEVEVEVWDSMLKGVDQGDKVSNWIDSFLGTHGLRLMHMGPSFERKIHPRLPGQVELVNFECCRLIKIRQASQIKGRCC